VSVETLELGGDRELAVVLVFFEQSALVWQAFVKDPDVSIREVLERSDAGLKVQRFARLEVGG